MKRVMSARQKNELLKEKKLPPCDGCGEEEELEEELESVVEPVPVVKRKPFRVKRKEKDK